MPLKPIYQTFYTKASFLIFLSCFLVSLSYAQLGRRIVNVRDTSVGMTSFRPQAAFTIPLGEWRERTGFFYSVGGSILNKTASQWLFGAEGYFFNGNRIKEKEHLQNLWNSSGAITAQDGLNGDVNRYFRGFAVSGLFGRLFPVGKPNMNSGFILTFGAGYMQHKIRTEVRQNNVWPLAKPYDKGYDRLSGGFMLSQFAGYQFVNNKRTITFFAGIEFVEAMTTSYRKFNYDNQQVDTDWKFNGAFSIKGGWMFTIYHKKLSKEYYK